QVLRRPEVALHANSPIMDLRAVPIPAVRGGPPGRQVAAHGDELIRYWQHALSDSAQLVFVMDTDCRIMAVSDALCAALDRPAGEIVGRRCTSMLHEGADCPPECPLHDVLASGAQQHADVFS